MAYRKITLEVIVHEAVLVCLPRSYRRFPTILPVPPAHGSFRMMKPFRLHLLSQ